MNKPAGRDNDRYPGQTHFGSCTCPNFRIITRVFRERKEILDGGIYRMFSSIHLRATGVGSVYPNDVADAQIRSIFYVTVTNAVVVVRVVGNRPWNMGIGIGHPYIGDVIGPFIDCIAIYDSRITLIWVNRFQVGTLCNQLKLIIPSTLHIREVDGCIVKHLISVGSIEENRKIKIL